VATTCWEAASSKPAMSRSASWRVPVPLIELFVLVLALRDFVLDRLFVDIKLRLLGVKGARMVDRADCRARRDSVEEITNISGGYTGSTGAGELGALPGVSTCTGLGGAGPSRRVSGGGVFRRF
jgi:hypothetical protein